MTNCCVSGRKGATVNGWTTPLWNCPSYVRALGLLLLSFFMTDGTRSPIDSTVGAAESDCEVATDLSTSATQSWNSATPSVFFTQ
jgi:hypothetical protein